jgi:tetratricopeptide (TPR) repeat protein
MKTIKIFISSVFKEMQVERDVLHRQISGVLHDKIQHNKLDVSFSFIDLRWGIDSRNEADSEKREQKIFDICFNAISECDIFVSFLGSKYGTVVDKKYAEYIFGIEKGESIGNRSITELEIICAKQSKTKSQCLFYFKLNGNEDNPNLTKLKEEIRESNYKTHNYSVMEYDGMPHLEPAFLARVIEDIYELIKRTVEENAYMGNGGKSIVTDYIDRPEYIDKCFNAIGNSSISILNGISGCGKSIILKIFAEKIHNAEYDILIGNPGKVNNLIDIIKQWLMVENIDYNGRKFAEIVELFVNALNSKNKKTIVIFDSVDGVQENELFLILSQFHLLDSKKCTVYMATSDIQLLNVAKHSGVNNIEIDNFSKVEIEQYVRNESSKYNKMIFPEVINAIINNKDLPVASPLYLSMIINDMLLYDMDTFNRMYVSEGDFVKNLIDYMLNKLTLYPNTLGDMCRYRLKQLDKYIYPTLAEFIYSMMAFYHTDLSLSTLKEIFTNVFEDDWDDVSYFTYKFILRGMVEIQDDNIYFTHGIIKYNALACVSNDISISYRKAIIKTLKCNTDVKMLEVVYQLFCLHDFTALLKFQEILNAEDMYKYYNAVIYAVEYFLLDSFSTCSKDLMVIDFIEDFTQTKVGVLMVYRLLTKLNLIERFNKFPNKIIDFYKKSIKKLELFIKDGEENTFFNINIVLIYDHIVEFAVGSGAEMLIKDLLDSMKDIYWTLNFETFSYDERQLYIDCLYRLALAYQSIDELYTAHEIYNKLIEYVLNQKIFCQYIPSIIDFYMQRKKIDIATKLCDEGINMYKSRQGFSINYANCLYKRFCIALTTKEYTVAINFGQKAYDVFYDCYSKDPVNIRNLYSYSIGCSAMEIVYLLLEQHDMSKEYLLKCYELRKYLLSIDANSYLYLDSFSKICLRIVSSKDSFTLEYRMEVLNSEFIAVNEYARNNNNIRAAWLFSNIYMGMQDIQDVTDVLIKNLKYFDELIDIIVSKNNSNSVNSFNNLNEICGILLRIFKTYCEQKNLPLKKGKAFIDIALKVAKLMVEIEISEESINNISNVAAEMSTIYSQQILDSFTNNSFVKDYKIYATHIYEKDKGNPFCVLLYISALQVELLPLLIMHTDLQNNAKKSKLMHMLMSEMNLNTEKMLIDNINEQIMLLKGIANKVKMQQNILLMMQVGCELVKKSDTASIDDKQSVEEVISMIKNIS